MVLNKIKQLKSKDIKILGLIDAKLVKIKADRKCKFCRKMHKAGSSLITASEYIDKKYNMNYMQAVKNSSTDNYRFVLVRFWACESCVLNCLQICYL